MTSEELAAKMVAQFAALDVKMDARFAAVDAKIDARFAAVDTQMEQGFNDSKVRDERLEGLITVEGEAHEVLREETNRQFVAADRKQDEQFKLLKEAVQHLSSRK